MERPVTVLVRALELDRRGGGGVRDALELEAVEEFILESTVCREFYRVFVLGH